MNCIAQCMPFQRDVQEEQYKYTFGQNFSTIFSQPIINTQHEALISKRINMSTLYKCVVRKWGSNENVFIAREIKDGGGKKEYNYNCVEFSLWWTVWGINLEAHTNLNLSVWKVFQGRHFCRMEIKRMLQWYVYLAWVAETPIIHTSVQSVSILRPNTRHYRMKGKASVKGCSLYYCA